MEGLVCVLTSRTSVCSGISSKPAASRMARRGRIWRLGAASTRIRNMEDTLGASLLIRGRQGVRPDAGRPDIVAACPHDSGAGRDPARGSGRLCRRLTGQVRVLSNTNALTEFLPDTLSSFLATHRHVSIDLEERLSDEIVDLDRRWRRRYRHHRRHRRCRTADDLSVPLRPFRAGGRARSSARASTAKIGFRRRARLRFCRARSRQRLAALSRRQGEPHRPAAAAARAVAQLRRGLPSGRSQCRRRHRAGNHGAARGEILGDQGGRTGGCLGAARSHHLRARLRRAAALCAAARQSHARRADEHAAA